MSAHEVSNRNALRDLIAGTTLWQEWTGLDETASKARIGWPESIAPSFPFIVIVTLGGGRRNRQGYDVSANFRSYGGLGVVVMSKIANGDDLKAADDAFALKFFGLMDAIVEEAHVTSLMIEDLTYGDNPYQISSINTSHPVDANEDGVDDEETIEQLFFQGQFTIATGVA
jgi:hypothetical protein